MLQVTTWIVKDWIGNVHHVGRFLIADWLFRAERWRLMFLSWWKFVTKRWRICGARQSKYRVCCPLFCFFPSILVEVKFWRIFFLFVCCFTAMTTLQSHSWTFKVSICYCSLVLFLAVSEKIYSQKMSSPETYSLC